MAVVCSRALNTVLWLSGGVGRVKSAREAIYGGAGTVPASSMNNDGIIADRRVQHSVPPHPTRSNSVISSYLKAKGYLTL